MERERRVTKGEESGGREVGESEREKVIRQNKGRSRKILWRRIRKRSKRK